VTKDEDGFAELLGSFGDVFGTLFGGGPLKPDVFRLLNISLLEAAHGAERTIEDVRTAACPSCGGRGGPKNEKPSPCMSCDGKGQTTVDHVGASRAPRACTFCYGTGLLWANPCPECEGRCLHDRPARWVVTIPAGVASGHTVCLEGEGNDLGDGPGDATFQVVVDPHPTLRRRGQDLVTKLRITEDVAERGGEVGVAWLDGPARLVVPAGTKHGVEVTLPGWGMVRFGEEYAAPPEPGSPYRSGDGAKRGDLIVTLWTHEEESQDPHEVLDLEPGASKEEIDTAYRLLVMRHHQDPNRDDPEALDRYDEINEAYANLTRPTAPASSPFDTTLGAVVLFLIAFGLLALAYMRF